MKLFAVLCLSLVSSLALSAPRPMLRLWVGFAQDREHLAPFYDAINERLIPETTAVGAGQGLTAYLPAFPVPGKYQFLPDEIALIAYRSEEAYNAIRSTPRGKRYGALHFEPGFFAKETPEGWKSGSEVAVPFRGSAANGAYVVGDERVDWQRGHQRFAIYLPVDGTRYRSAVAALLRSLPGRGLTAVARVTDRYVLLLVHAESLRAIDLDGGDALYLLQKLPVEAQPAGRTVLLPGEGISVRFTP